MLGTRLYEALSLGANVLRGNGIFGDDFDPFAGLSEDEIKEDLDIPVEQTAEDEWWR